VPYDLDEAKTYTRILQLPDGLDYVIAMNGWFWMSLDWTDEYTDWKINDSVIVAWRTAQEMQRDDTMRNPGNFVAEFTDAFRSIISLRMRELVAAQEAENSAASLTA
jgi:hypothetical protein